MKVDKIGYMTEEKGNERFNKSSTYNTFACLCN